METIARRVVGNTVWQLVQRIGGRVLSYVLVIYLARQLGAAEFGKFVFAGSFIRLFLILSDLGVTPLMIREIARDKSIGSQYVGNVTVLKIFLSVFTFVTILVAMRLLGVASDTRAIICTLSIYFILENIGTSLGGVFQAYEQMSYNTLVEIGQRLFLLLTCFILLSSGYTLEAVCWAYVISAICHCSTKFCFVRFRFVAPRYEFDLAFWKQLLKESFPMAVVAAISMIYYSIDMVMLEKIKGEEVVGWYGVSYHLFFALSTVSGAFLAAMFPVMSKLFKTSPDSLGKVYEKSFKTIFAFGLPVSFGGVLLAEKIILFLYGTSYQQSIRVFQVFSFIIVFSLVNSLAGYFLTSINRQGQVARAIVLTTSINIALNLIFIPRFSYMGAAWATFISEILFFSLTFLSIPREFRRVPVLSICKGLASCAVMGGGLFLLIPKGPNLFILILVGAALYLLSMLLLGYLAEEDRQVLRSIIVKRERGEGV